MARPFFMDGIDRLRELAKPGTLCAFDFDGTLAPIADDPTLACIPSPVLRRLAALGECAPVAVITGRSVEDIGLRLDFFPDFVVGNHGAEGIPGQEQHANRHAAQCAGWRVSLQRALDDGGWGSGIWIEDKTYSLSVHFRHADDPVATGKGLRRLLLSVVPEAKVVGGKCVLNILPADAPDKGTALTALRGITAAPSAIYVGDDLTDESVFGLPHADLLGVRIEDDPATAAEFYLQDPAGIIGFLDVLIEILGDVRERRKIEERV